MSPRRAKAVALGPDQDPSTALREHLISATQELIATSTISSITTRQIAQRSSVSEGVIYNYFDDKQDLIVSALRRRFDGVVDAFEAAMPTAGEGTIDENLRAIARSGSAMQDDVLPIFVGLLSEPDLLRRFMDEVHREPMRAQLRISAYLSDEQRLGRIAASADIGAVTALLMGASFIGALGRHLAPDHARGRPMQQGSAIVATLMDGLRPRHTPL
jgi:AcrR family transcriptional regulator